MSEEKKINRFYRIVQTAKEKEELILLEKRKAYLNNLQNENTEDEEKRLLRRPESKSLFNFLRRDNIKYENKGHLLRREEKAIEQEVVKEVETFEKDVKEVLKPEEMLIFKIREKRNHINNLHKSQEEYLNKK